MNTPTALTSQTAWSLAEERSRRILVLEGCDRSRSRVVGELVVAGWEVLHAASPADALVAWVGSRRPIDLLIVDPFSTGDEGLRLCRLLRSVQPGLGLLLWASHAEEVELGDEPAAERVEDGPLAREVRRVLRPGLTGSSRRCPAFLDAPGPTNRPADRWPLLQLRGILAYTRQAWRGLRAHLRG